MPVLLAISISFLFLCLFVNLAYIKIIAPTILQRLQFKIFSVRDSARLNLIRGTIDDEEFRFVEDRCNFAISFVKTVDLAVFLKMNKIIKNLSDDDKMKLSREAEKHKESKFVKDSLWEISSVIRKAIVANSGYWGALFWGVFFLIKGPFSGFSYVKKLANVTKQIATEFPERALDSLRRFPNRSVSI